MHALRLIPGILVILLLAIAPAAAQETPKGPAKPAQVTEEKEKHSPLPTRTIPLAFIWLAEHQSRDGSWRFDPPAGDKKGFENPGTWNSPTAATALSLWPFLAAGQTHMTKGTNRERVSAGLLWLMKHQGPDGDLSAGCSRAMFAHAHVILSQVREGAETGSWWNPEDLRAVEGGRLFQTAINPLMLEVYYGYPKLYKIEEATTH